MINEIKCECPLTGFCARHGVEKHPHWHALCQTRGDYFRAWEECRGPGQTKDCIPAVSRGFGDSCAKFFRATGIAKAIKWTAQKLSLPCGCAGRQAQLNQQLPYSTDAQSP